MQATLNSEFKPTSHDQSRTRSASGFHGQAHVLGELLELELRVLQSLGEVTHRGRIDAPPRSGATGNVIFGRTSIPRSFHPRIIESCGRGTLEHGRDRQRGPHCGHHR